MRRAAFFFALAVAGCGTAAPTAGANDDLTPGATVIYYRQGPGGDVRIVKVDACYVTEIVYNGRWQMLNSGGLFSTKATYACGDSAQPVAP